MIIDKWNFHRYSIGAQSVPRLFHECRNKTQSFLRLTLRLTIFAQRKLYDRLHAFSPMPVPKKETNHGIVAERGATRENPTAEIRQRQLGQAVQLVCPARPAGSAHEAEPGRGESRGGAPTGVPGQALIGDTFLGGTVTHRTERITTLRGSSCRGTRPRRRLVVGCLSSGGSRTSRFSAFFTNARDRVCYSSEKRTMEFALAGSMNRLNCAAPEWRRNGAIWYPRDAWGSC